MEIAITIFQILLDNRDNISLTCVALSIIIAAFLCLHEHKEKLWKRIYNRRNKYYFAMLVLSLAAIIALIQLCELPSICLMILVTEFVFYTALCCLDLRICIKATHPMLKKYQKLLDKGFAIENADFFDKENHWYLLEPSERIQYKLLRASYYSTIGNDVSAYKALCSIDEKYLYEEEKTYVDMRKAMHLAMMGNMTTARMLLGNPEENRSEDPRIWITYAYIVENTGDMDAAFSYAQKAKGLLDLSKISKAQSAAVYNDYARYALFCDNENESLRYYELAFEEAKQSDNANCLNIVASNFTVRTAIYGDIEKCKRIFSEYIEYIDTSSLGNTLEYENALMVYNRQFYDDKEVFDLIKNGYTKAMSKLNQTQKTIFKASTFGMLMSGCYRHEWFDAEVDSDMNVYMSLPLPERLQVFKEYMSVFMQPELAPICRAEPYAMLYKNILSYYQNTAVAEIDEYLKSVESYNVLKYKFIVMHKLGILKYIEGKEHIIKSRQQYLNLYKTLLNEGCQLDAANVLMIFIDECESPYNILLTHPHLEPIYFCDFLALNPPPEPTEAPDGIHLFYHDLFLPPYISCEPLQTEEIRNKIEDLIALYNNWQNHPVKIEYSIGIAATLIKLGRREEAQSFWNFFKESGQSPDHFARWFKKHIAMLAMEFEHDPKA